MANQESRSNGSPGAEHTLDALRERPVAHLTFVDFSGTGIPRARVSLLRAERKERHQAL